MARGRGRHTGSDISSASEASNDMLSSMASHSLPPNETRSLEAAEGRWSGREKWTGETSLSGESENWLPPGYKYHFCTYRLCTTQGDSHLDHTSFEASLRIALTEICEVKEWVKKLSESSGVSWRVAVTKPNKGQRVLYKAHYRCQHNVYVRSDTANQRRLSKNTCCEAKLICTLVKTTDKRGGTSRYRKFLTYLQSLYSRRESWALSYRRDLPTRGNQTNNYVEAAMRVLKDKILQRTKAFNLPQLFNLFITRLEMYYKARVTDVALGHWEAFHRSRLLATQSNIKASDISQVGEKTFQVRSSTSGHTYTVDMELELCTCPVGHSGAPCKHQAAVVQNYNITSINFLPTTAEMRAKLLKITKASVSLDFLNPLRQNMPTPSTLAPDMPPRQETCTIDHQYHLSAQDDESHQLDLSSTSSAQLRQTSPMQEDSYSNQPCVQVNSEGGETMKLRDLKCPQTGVSCEDGVRSSILEMVQFRLTAAVRVVMDSRDR
ncbi:uncharacterized protein [Sinocyclocheilus grahami]|uniref:uncharacterized protein n=1 Tax=Sinocyclocheilus grahami TaxID=75366 RepID=UPI0007AD2B66|nr:PREDICTED: uncharacterized protein LOC107573782 [Sinocyclocheilus grahami]